MNVFDELDLDEIFKNSSEEAKLKAKQNLPDDIEPTKENISIQIKKEELIKEEEKNIQQQIRISKLLRSILKKDISLSRATYQVQERV